MFRAIPVIVQAILLSRPTMPAAEARRYAHVLQHEAIQHGYDPFTAVAIIHYESRWRPGVISPDGEDYGLGQIRGRWLSACRNDEDPVHQPSAGCLAAKNALLVGENNLRRMSVIITANRDLCKAKTGSSWLPRWLAGYEGLNPPYRDRWCAPNSRTLAVVDYRQQLVATFAPKAKLRAPKLHGTNAHHAGEPSPAGASPRAPGAPRPTSKAEGTRVAKSAAAGSQRRAHHGDAPHTSSRRGAAR